MPLKYFCINQPLNLFRCISMSNFLTRAFFFIHQLIINLFNQVNILQGTPRVIFIIIFVSLIFGKEAITYVYVCGL